MEFSSADLSFVVGPGWRRVADAVAAQVPPESIEAIYLFQPLRRGGREWGTAVVTSVAPDTRRRVFQARYWLQLRGKERGRARVEVREVGLGPERAVQEVLAGVQLRAGEAEPPVQVDPRWWYEG